MPSSSLRPRTAPDSAAEPVSFLNSWTIQFEVDRTNAAAFEDGNITYVSGLPDASGDFAGFYDTAHSCLCLSLCVCSSFGRGLTPSLLPVRLSPTVT